MSQTFSALLGLWPSTLKMKIIEAHKSGEGNKKITRHFQVAVSSVYTVIKKWQLRGSAEVTLRSERPKRFAV